MTDAAAEPIRRKLCDHVQVFGRKVRLHVMHFLLRFASFQRDSGGPHFTRAVP